MSERTPVFVHIGLMKTGTTTIQRTLRGSSEAVAEQGLTLLPDNQILSHRMALAARGLPFDGDLPHQGHRVLARLARQVERAPGDRCLITAETLSFLGADGIRDFVAALGPRADPHVVVTVRALDRSLPSAWQQRVKGGRSLTFEAFLDQLRASVDADRVRPNGQDVRGILALWSQVVPAERIHVVVVPSRPRPGVPSLVERFCSVVGLDPATLADPERENESIGRVQTEMLRRLNEVLPDELLAPRVHGHVVKRFFAERVLAAQEGGRIVLPDSARGWVGEESQAVAASIAASGCHVVGDLDELLVEAPQDDDPGRDQDLPSDAEVLDAAFQALVGLLAERAATHPA